MAMTTGNSGDFAVEVNTTPLIDVMLVLLTLLIITLPAQTHAVKLNMPTTSPPPPVEVQTVNLRVDFDGSYFWNNRQVDRATLATYFRRSAALADQPEIHLDADRLAPYDKVAEALGDAQRLGVTKIGFSNVTQYE